MLLTAAPLLGDALERGPLLKGRDELTALLGSYEATRTLTECFLESLPQLALQLWMVFGNHGADVSALGLDGSGVLYRAIVASAVNTAFVLASNYTAMRRQGLGPRAYGVMLLEIGGGKAGNLIKRVAANDATLVEDGVVDLSNLGVTDAHARMLAKALEGNTVVTGLKLGGNAFGDDAARSIGEALGGNEALRERIKVEEGPRYVDKYSTAVATWFKIARVADDDATLPKWLDLERKGLKDAHVAALAEALKTNTHVTTLRLTGNKAVTDAGGRALLDMLRTNTAVQAISLGGCEGMSEAVREEVERLAKDPGRCSTTPPADPSSMAATATTARKGGEKS